MKKLLAMMCLIPSISFALTNTDKQSLQMSTYQAACVNGKDLTSLVGEFKEIPFARGISTPIVGEGALSLVLFVSPSQKTFTIAEKVGADLYCILAVGGGFEPVPKEIQDSVTNEYEKGKL